MAIEFLLDKICLEHNAGIGHPEQPLRIKKIIDYFNKNNLQNLVDTKDVISKELLDKMLFEIHDKNLIERVKESENKKETYFDQDTQANNKTYKAALKAGSLAMSAAQLTTVGKTSFSIMRPPGHHATPNRIMGFCFFNNISLATQNLLQRNKRVAIVDFDFHYGNGTADIFWKNPNVLYISIHADPSLNFPNQGFIDEIGSKDGKGYNVCLPLTFNSGNNEILYSIQELILPLLNEYKPSIVGVSAGFDGYYDDPVGGGFLQYTAEGYYTIGKLLYNYSKETGTPFFHILEGGYNLDKLPELVQSYCKPWMANGSKIRDEIKQINAQVVKSREKKMIEYVKQLIKPYWNIK